jgi:hypothetical protein
MLDSPITDAKNSPIIPRVTEAREEVPEIGGGPVAGPEQDRVKNNPIGSTSPAPQPQPAGSGNLALHADRPDKASLLSDIRINCPDSRGIKITAIYAVQSDEYAVYQAGEVMVHFADDPAKAETQRKSILPISAARAEVNALAQDLACREVCDRQLAYALQLALDGAKAITTSAKAAVLAKRAASGRFQYLKWSFATAALLIALLFLASRLFPFSQPSSDLWLAAKAGLIGAAFSIALGIRGRTVALDTELLDNITDGTLRLLIGVIAAGVLLLLFASGIVPSLKIGDADFKSSNVTWQIVLIIGFVAGFLERLVPDLLDKQNSKGIAAPVQ